MALTLQAYYLYVPTRDYLYVPNSDPLMLFCSQANTWVHEINKKANIS
jgi:hypothetical protein